MTAEADMLVQAGRVQEAAMLLNQLAAQGNADALFKLGSWRITGNIIPRDLTAARELLRKASEAGHSEATAIYTAFVANGTGGPSDWPLATQLLRKAARRDDKARRQLKLIEKMDLTPTGDPVRVPEGQELSKAPYVVRFDGLLTAAECSYLVAVAGPRFRPSVIVDQTGHQVPNPVRTSDGAGFPWALENPAIHAINRWLAAISATDASNGEPLQVLRYAPGQEYKPHFDAVPGLENQRHLTALIYLNDDYEGGETLFTKTGLKVRGGRGDAILFRNSDSSGAQLDETMHAGLPVTKGVKLLASRWIRQRRLEA